MAGLHAVAPAVLSHWSGDEALGSVGESGSEQIDDGAGADAAVASAVARVSRSAMRMELART